MAGDKPLRPFTFTPLFPMPILIAIGLILLYSVAYHPPANSAASVVTESALVSITRIVHQIGLAIFQSQSGLQTVFVLAMIAHAVEGAFAFVKAKGIPELSNVHVAMWTVQTLCWGFPSLRLLNKTAALYNARRK